MYREVATRVELVEYGVYSLQGTKTNQKWGVDGVGGVTVESVDRSVERECWLSQCSWLVDG